MLQAGDPVNVAARMETNSTAGRINISENTYQLVKDHFECTYRGEINVKNKGMMKMYFVEGPLRKADSRARSGVKKSAVAPEVKKAPAAPEVKKTPAAPEALP